MEHAVSERKDLVTFVSSDEVEIQTELAIAKCSVLVRNMIEDKYPGVEKPIPMMNVNAKVLEKVLQWCDMHKGDMAQENDDLADSDRGSAPIEKWDREFMEVDQEFLFEIILAANYMEIIGLLDLGCRTVANMIKGRTTEEIRKTFNIENDFTPEEEEQIRRENEWAEDH